MNISLKRIGKTVLLLGILVFLAVKVVLTVTGFKYSTLQFNMNHQRSFISDQYIGYTIKDSESVGNGLYDVWVGSSPDAGGFNHATAVEPMKKGTRVMYSEVSYATSTDSRPYARFAQRVK